jgi:hypothetical protein
MSTNFFYPLALQRTCLSYADLRIQGEAEFGCLKGGEVTKLEFGYFFGKQPKPYYP